MLLCAVVASSSCHEREEHHTTTYLNEWGVEVQGGEERARAVAEETGFLYVSRVSLAIKRNKIIATAFPQQMCVSFETDC